MDYELVIDSLCLEVTRRCNMECAHCMRGNAQNIDMSYECVDRIVDLATQINHITFTGGEPSLNIPLIKYTFEVMLKKYGYLPPFFVATNGKANQQELALLLMDAYFNVDEKEMCSAAISTDRFHEKVDEKNYLRLMPFYSNSKVHSDGESDRWVLDVGNGKENGVGMKLPYGKRTGELHLEIHPGVLPGQKDMIQVETCTLTATGEILNECDYAYNDIDGYRICALSELDGYLTRKLLERKAKEE